MFDEKIIPELFRLYGPVYTSDDKTLVTKIGKSFLLVFEENVIRIYGLGYTKKTICEKFMCDYGNGDCKLSDEPDDYDLNFMYDTNNKLVSTHIGGAYTLWINANDTGVIVPDQSVTNLFIKRLRLDRPLIFNLIDKHTAEGTLNIMLNTAINDDANEIDFQLFDVIININTSAIDAFCYQAFRKLISLKNTKFFYISEHAEYIDDLLKHLSSLQKCPTSSTP